ncbi:hypothetical protein F5888DRAFT_1867378 [Russula emetica]|nr:hypothetical protein F5888DRAFT_1867378 [Russula emetica]
MQQVTVWTASSTDATSATDTTLPSHPSPSIMDEKGHHYPFLKPSDRAMIECLKEMLTHEAQGPTYIIMDALDEYELVGLQITNLHICVTSRPLRYAAYEAPPPAQLRHPSAARSASRSTPSLDSYDDLTRTVTAGDLAIAAGSPELRGISSPAQSPSVSPLPKLETINLLSPRADLISLDTPFFAEPKPDNVEAPEQGEQSDDFASVWDTVSAFSARGWYDGTLDAAVRRLQGLGFP